MGSVLGRGPDDEPQHVDLVGVTATIKADNFLVFVEDLIVSLLGIEVVD